MLVAAGKRLQLLCWNVVYSFRRREKSTLTQDLPAHVPARGHAIPRQAIHSAVPAGQMQDGVERTSDVCKAPAVGRLEIATVETTQG